MKYSQWIGAIAIAALLLVCYLSYSVLSVLHQAWGARLGGDEGQRSRIVSWREGLALAGVLVIVAAIVWLRPEPTATAPSVNATNSVAKDPVSTGPGGQFGYQTLQPVLAQRCYSCHGAINEMKVVYQHEPQSMSWCLDCHRAPENHLRPPSEIYNMAWKPTGQETQREIGMKFKEEWEVNPPVTCGGCHR